VKGESRFHAYFIFGGFVMKKFLSILLSLIMMVSFAACSSGGGNQGDTGTTPSNEQLAGDSKVLVVYFSWSSSHNTETMAGYVAETTGGELFRLIPETPYSTNYNTVVDQAQKEKSEKARPALKEDLSAEEFANYDVIFIGYPIWWYDAPMIVYTFLESHDFTGKTIVPFATSGGSGLNEEESFRSLTGAEVKDGLCISGFSAGSNSKTRVENWISELGYNKE